MSRLSTRKQKAHSAALATLAGDTRLDYDATADFLEAYQEGAENLNGLSGAFFTPLALARDFALEVSGATVIDLCAGVGTLSYAVSDRNSPLDNIVCVEKNPAYVAIGKRLVPDARWVEKDVLSLSEDSLEGRPKFDVAISNPPFGNISGIGMFDLEVVRISSLVAKRGVFILPQQSTPFRYSGQQCYSETTSDALRRWMDATGIEFEFNIGIDCNAYIDAWHGVAPTVEIVTCDFNH
jgi:predicted RNA methylase